MNKIDLSTIFKKIDGCSYVLVKPPENITSYIPGSDLDIFCANLNQMVDAIVSALNGLIVNTELEVSITKYSDQVHIDVIYNEKIDIRFDLFGRLADYKHLKIKNSLFDVVIYGAKKSNSLSSETFNVYVPSEVDDLLLRYLEYLEYIASRPDKIKHMEIILNDSDEVTRAKLVNKFHEFTMYNLTQNKPGLLESSLKPFKNVIQSVRYFSGYVKSHGIRKTLSKAWSKYVK